MRGKQFRWAWAAMVLAWGGAWRAAAANALLPWSTERHSNFDLEVTGLLDDVPAGESRFIAWADIRALPTTALHLKGEFVSGDQVVTIVWLADLMGALPVRAAGDTVVATCTDGYWAIYTAANIADCRPFVVLEINGDEPDKWPPAGLRFNPGPYVISVSDTVAPAVDRLLDAMHKQPWGVNKLELANYATLAAPAFDGPWAHLSTSGDAGREIWIHSCTSCHAGPNGLAGGTKSGWLFAGLAARAKFQPDYFAKYVRDPKSLNAEARMQAHPHYNDAQIAALIAFVTADGAWPESAPSTAPATGSGR